MHAYIAARICHMDTILRNHSPQCDIITPCPGTMQDATVHQCVNFFGSTFCVDKESQCQAALDDGVN